MMEERFKGQTCFVALKNLSCFSFLTKITYRPTDAQSVMKQKITMMVSPSLLAFILEDAILLHEFNETEWKANQGQDDFLPQIAHLYAWSRM